MCGPESPAQKLSRQGMTHTHLLPSPGVSPSSWPQVFQLLSSSPGLAKKGREPVTYRPPTPRLPSQVQGTWGLLEFQLEAENQASSQEQDGGQEKGPSVGGEDDQISRQGLRLGKEN